MSLSPSHLSAAKTNLRWSFAIEHLHIEGSLKKTFNKPLRENKFLPVSFLVILS